MKKTTAVTTIALIAIAMLPASAADKYEIDAAHSSVVFRVMHNGVAWNYGRFNQFDGTIEVDEKDPSKSSVAFDIDAASIDTANAKRDDHLRNSDFFNTKEFPKINFKSTKIEPVGDKKYKVSGDLTMVGQTKPVTANVEITGLSDGLAGALVNLTIKRSEFGMKYGIPKVGDEVEVTLGIEGKKQ